MDKNEQSLLEGINKKLINEVGILESIKNKLTWVIILLAILTIGIFLVNAKLTDVISGLDTISDRIDLTISAIEREMTSMSFVVENGMEQIFDRLGRMKLY